MTTLDAPKTAAADAPPPPLEHDQPSVAMPVPQLELLFVSGNAAWSGQMQHELQNLQPGWRCRSVLKGDLARIALTTGTIGAVVVDAHVTDGTKWLETAVKNFPNTIFLVRCDLLDSVAAAKWSQTGATLLTEAVSAASLAGNLIRIGQLRAWMNDPALKKLLPLIRKLPTAPKLHADVTRELRSPNGSFDVVARLISQEPVMSAKILQVVNSAFFGLSHEVTDTSEAVMVLGAERIRALILLAGVFSQYGSTKSGVFSPEPVWAHSLQVGLLARAIALGETRDSAAAEAAFTAGLLHDIGKLILAGNLPDIYDAIRQLQANTGCTARAAELEVTGTTHAALGACLLAAWGLPLSILEAIAWHHEPSHSKEPGFSLLAAIHCANVFANEGVGAGAHDEIDIQYLEAIGLVDCRNRWREYCGLAETA